MSQMDLKGLPVLKKDYIMTDILQTRLENLENLTQPPMTLQHQCDLLSYDVRVQFLESEVKMLSTELEHYKQEAKSYRDMAMASYTGKMEELSAAMDDFVTNL